MMYKIIIHQCIDSNRTSQQSYFGSLEAYTNLACIKFYLFPGKPVCSPFHLVYDGQDLFFLCVFVPMVNSSNMFPAVFSLNYNQQSVITCQIGVLEGNPFRR